MKINVELPAGIKKQGVDEEYYEDLQVTVNKDASKIIMNLEFQTEGIGSQPVIYHQIELIFNFDELRRCVEFFKTI